MKDNPEMTTYLFDKEIKIIPFKKCCVNYPLEKEVKTIKVVRQSSSVSEMVMCDICSASLTSKYLDRQLTLKSMHSDNPLV